MQQPEQDPIKALATLAAYGLVAFVVIVCIEGLWKAIAPHADRLWQEVNSKPTNVARTVVVFVCGNLLYTLRQHHRTLYGRIEVVFAIVLSWLAIDKLPQAQSVPLTESVHALAGMLTAAYLVVRGRDNIDEGKKQVTGTTQQPARPT